MKRTTILPVLLAGLLVAACGGSSGSDTSPGTDAAVSVAPVETPDTDPPDTEPEATLPPDTEPEPVDTEPADTAPADTEPTDTESDAPAAGGLAFDDTPLCAALADVIAAAFIPGLIAAFASIGGSDDGEGAADAEISSAIAAVELLVYPAVEDSVAVVRAEVPDEFAADFDLAYSRFLGATDALAAGGFTAEEITALRTAGRTAVDDVLAGRESTDELSTEDPALAAKFEAAIAAYLAAEGSLLDDSADVGDDAEFDSFVETECPVLVASLDTLFDVSISSSGGFTLDDDGLTVTTGG